MRFSLLSSLLFCVCVAGCSTAYKSLVSATAKNGCVERFKPAFNSALYNTQVNVVGRHLSGLLLFKLMPDSSLRVVFSSEMGVKFFDFGFGNDGSFKVFQVMRQLDKKTVIKTLKSDFELILMRDLRTGDLTNKEQIVKQDSSGNTWYGFNSAGETHYYIMSPGCDSLLRIENAMKRKPKVQIIMQNYRLGIPDTIGISHKNFNFEIGLKYIQR